MRNNIFLLRGCRLALIRLSLLLTLAGSAVAADVSTTTLWFDQQAKNFHASLPLGNGRIGAMVFGGVDEGGSF